jgi:hypothetical protein
MISAGSTVPSQETLDAIPWDQRDWSPAQFCKFKNISPWLYGKMKREGRGPETLMNSPKLRRVTPAAHAEWEERMRAEAASKKRGWKESAAAGICASPAHSVQARKVQSKATRKEPQPGRPVLSQLRRSSTFNAKTTGGRT